MNDDKVRITFFGENAEGGYYVLKNTGLSYEAYRAMTDYASPLPPYTEKQWRRLTTRNRLSRHLDAMRDDIGACSYEFSIYNIKKGVYE